MDWCAVPLDRQSLTGKPEQVKEAYDAGNSANDSSRVEALQAKTPSLEFWLTFSSRWLARLIGCRCVQSIDLRRCSAQSKIAECVVDQPCRTLSPRSRNRGPSRIGGFNLNSEPPVVAFKARCSKRRRDDEQLTVPYGGDGNGRS